MNRADVMEVEALNYWLSMRKLNALYRIACMPDDIDDVKAELVAMSMHTEWPQLRSRCNAAVNDANIATDVA